MIALVKGEVAVRRPDHVVVECGGVGYRLAVSETTLRQVPAVGNQVLLHAHLVLRDDGMALFGFASEEERDLFLMLNGVQGVGPKVALAVLSGGTPRDLIRTLALGDKDRLQAVPGIGKRTAERIIVELREKVSEDLASPEPEASGVVSIEDGEERDARFLARDGLVGLGFTIVEADRLLEKAAGETPEDLIEEALKASRS